MAELNLENLVLLAKSDTKAFGELYDRIFDQVYRYVFRRLNDHQNTEDLISQIFFDIFRNLQRYNNQGTGFMAWVYTISRNRVIDWYRKNGRMNIVALDEVENLISGDTQDQQENIDNDQLINEIKQAMETMDEADREIIYLKHFEELSNSEIAEVMDLSANHVGVKLFRAIKKLRNLLQDKL